MYNHEPPGYVCPFCLIVRSEYNAHVYSYPEDIVLRNENITALISSHQWPNNPGNVVIIPNVHFENIYTLPVEFASAIHAAAQRIALAMKTGLGCDGVSTRQHNEPAGNQDVWHYHLHITPRYTNDDFYGSGRGAKMPPGERARLAQVLREALSRL